MSGPGKVLFVGGELDGKMYVLPELKPRHYVPYLRRQPVSWGAGATDFNPDDAPPFGETEYVLTKKGGAYYYVEIELMRLSQKQSVDPRPEAEPMIENIEKKYTYINETRGAALEQMSVPELITLLKEVHEANPNGDEDWKQDIRSALVRKAAKEGQL